MEDSSPKKSVWDRVKDGFKPAQVRADEQIAEAKSTTGDQYAQDRKEGQEAMKKKFLKGFYNN